MAARDDLGIAHGHRRREPDPARAAVGSGRARPRARRGASPPPTKAGVRGKAVTPFLLGFIVERSGGRSLEVNLDLARNNVRVAADDRDRLVGARLGRRP